MTNDYRIVITDPFVARCGVCAATFDSWQTQRDPMSWIRFQDEHDHDAPPERRAAVICPHCAAGAPHHTNSRTSIGGADRIPVYDLHEVDDTGGVGLAECLAYDAVWKSSEPLTPEG